jgi:hypothetical protein
LRDGFHVCIRGVTADSDFFLAGLMWVSNNYNAKRATQNNRTHNQPKQRTDIADIMACRSFLFVSNIYSQS